MASEAVKRQRAVRRRMLGRTMMACSALFLAVFTLMAGQLMLGHDPALGAGRQPKPSNQVAQRPQQPSDWKSVAGQAVGAVIGGVISEGAGDDEGAAPATAQPSPAPSQAPAPVQSGTS